MARGELMIGPGGVARRPRSESAEITRALNSLADALNAETEKDAALYIRESISILQRLRSQVAEGYHHNPSSSRMYEPFKIIDVIGTEVDCIAYKHAKDGKRYKHDFRRGSAEVIAVERHGRKELLITSPSGVPLWDEF